MVPNVLGVLGQTKYQHVYGQTGSVLTLDCRYFGLFDCFLFHWFYIRFMTFANESFSNFNTFQTTLFR